MRLITRLRQLLGPPPPPLEGAIPKPSIRKYLPEAPAVIEAGAHVGTDTVEMSRLWPNGIIYAFEPIPALFDKLRTNIRRQSNVQCYNLALGERTGAQQMFVSNGASNGSSSLLSPTGHLIDHPDTFFTKTIAVQAMTIDDWAQEQGVVTIDLLWLDMQGAELATLKSAPRILKTAKVIHAEVSVREQYAGGPLYAEVRQWLAGQGFRVEAEALPPHWDGGNVLFVRDRG